MNANTIYNQRSIDEQEGSNIIAFQSKLANIAFDKQRTLQKAENKRDYAYGKYPSTKQSAPTILISTRSNDRA